jgi:predicted GNAT superfamily acetyltransferase
MKYQIKQTNELTETEIEHILQLWDISSWNSMKSDYFRTFFKNSTFHFLLDADKNILSLIRVNYDFVLEISGIQLSFAEAVGLVAAQKKKGYGAKLVEYFREYVVKNNIETIGFCHQELRPFYEKCNVEILYDKGKAIKENTGSEWINSEDDDILIFNVSAKRKEQLNLLSDKNNAYLITKE